jgi:hypothetical protein
MQSNMKYNRVKNSTLVPSQAERAWFMNISEEVK